MRAPKPGVLLRAHVVVEGRVQGVFFRGSVREQAVGAGLRGWVRNLPDGRVEAVFEGEAAQVQALVDFSRSGPRGARVTGAEVSFAEARGEFTDFSIRY